MSQVWPQIMSSSSASSPTTTSTPNASSNAPNSTLIIVAVVVILAIALISITAFFIVRARRRPSPDLEDKAARITPFGSAGGETPRFCAHHAIFPELHGTYLK